ncbi:unnamed protein product [Symbiodinium sp. CCMP2592]|nr:unnamed protein product [Symbiodinium sp. CCMP2592]
MPGLMELDSDLLPDAWKDDAAGIPASSRPSPGLKKQKVMIILTCVICGRKSQDTPWGLYDEQGKPVGILCRRDKKIIVRIYPGEDVAKVCDKLEQDPAVKQIVQNAIKVVEEETQIQLNPPSLVQRSQQQGYQVYYKLAFLDQDEMTSLCKDMTPSACGYKPVELKVENGGTQLGYLMSPVGMPEQLWRSCRRVKVIGSKILEHNELFLQPENQLAQIQGTNTWKWITKTELEKREAALKSKSGGLRYTDVVQKALEVKEHRKEELGAGKANDEAAGHAVVESESEEDEAAKQLKQLHADAQASGSLEMNLGTLEEEDKKKPKGRGAKAKAGSKARKESPSRLSRGGRSSTTGKDKEKELQLDDANLSKLAGNLARIAQRINKIPECFLKLNPECFTVANGRSVDAARRMLTQMEKEGDKNQHLLRPYVVAAEAATLLSVKDGLDKVKRMTKANRLMHLEAIKAVSWDVPVQVQCAHTVAEVEAAFEDLLQSCAASSSNSKESKEAKVERIIAKIALTPNSAATFDWNEPTFDGLLTGFQALLERSKLFGDGNTDVDDEAASMEARQCFECLVSRLHLVT